MKGVWLATVTMKPMTAFGLSQTNQQLLQEGLISPLVFELLELLERHRAKTSEQRFEVIRDACSARQLPDIDCGTSRRRRDD